MFYRVLLSPLWSQPKLLNLNDTMAVILEGEEDSSQRSTKVLACIYWDKKYISVSLNGAPWSVVNSSGLGKLDKNFDYTSLRELLLKGEL